MATKNIVPRATGEGGIGTSIKRWLCGFFNSLDVANGTNAPVNTLQRSTTYALNDVAFYSGIDAKYFLKCTTAGTTDSTVPSFTGVTSGSTVTDGTVVWTVKTLGSEEQFDDFLPLTGGTVTGNLSVSGTITGNLTGNATNDGLGNNIANTYLPAVVGAVIAFAGSTSPAGWLLCDGSAVSRTDYAALFAIIGTTYGAGDGSATFNLPNLTDKFVQGNATSGTEKSAGLPNIIGDAWSPEGANAGAGYYTARNGAFTSIVGLGNHTYAALGGANNDQNSTLRFDASLCSPIYGNSATVQPPSVTMRYIIKY